MINFFWSFKAETAAAASSAFYLYLSLSSPFSVLVGRKRDRERRRFSLLKANIQCKHSVRYIAIARVAITAVVTGPTRAMYIQHAWLFAAIKPPKTWGSLALTLARGAQKAIPPTLSSTTTQHSSKSSLPRGFMGSSFFSLSLFLLSCKYVCLPVPFFACSV